VDKSHPKQPGGLRTDDKDNLAKQSTALDLIERLRVSGDGVLSTQVLTEYFNGARSR
jgi:hypothetical protein